MPICLSLSFTMMINTLPSFFSFFLRVKRVSCGGIDFILFVALYVIFYFARTGQIRDLHPGGRRLEDSLLVMEN